MSEESVYGVRRVMYAEIRPFGTYTADELTELYEFLADLYDADLYVTEPQRTVGFGTSLIDPDCQASKHSSCVGFPCECYCHADDNENTPRLGTESARKTATAEALGLSAEGLDAGPGHRKGTRVMS